MFQMIQFFIRGKSNDITTVLPEIKEADTPTSSSIHGKSILIKFKCIKRIFIVNTTTYDYFARRRLVDDAPLPSNSSNNRKILADIFGEPGKFVIELSSFKNLG